MRSMPSSSMTNGGARVVRERVAGGEVAEVVANHIDQSTVDGHRTHRCIASAETLPQEKDVGSDAEMLHGEVSPGAAQSGQNFVGDEKDVVAVAYLADSGEVLGRRHRGARRGAADRFGGESSEALGGLARQEGLA